MKVAIIGAGEQAKGIVHDLLNQIDVDRIYLGDINLQHASKMAALFKNDIVEPLQMDAQHHDRAVRIFRSCTVAISAAPYRVNYILARAAIEAGCHFCDLGGNNEIVEMQRELSADADWADVAVVPAVGLAPGLPAVLAADAVDDFDEVDLIEVRVGGLPVNKDLPLGYTLSFSIEGLINEYIEPSRIIDFGEIKTVPSLTGIETLRFPDHTDDAYEAFFTSGALSTIPDTLGDQIFNLNYKTIRYPGHVEFFRTLNDMGMFSSKHVMVRGVSVRPRKMFEQLAAESLRREDEPDMILMRTNVKGKRNGLPHTRVYEMVVYGDGGMSAMVRATAIPASIVALMLGRGDIVHRGFSPLETCVDSKEFMRQMRHRGVKIDVRDYIG